MSEGQVISLGDIEDAGETSFSVHAEPFDRIRDEWIALHTAAKLPGPFQRPEWHEAWLRHFPPGGEPVYLAIRHEETLIGVAPLVMGGGAARELGDPDVRDYAGPLAAEGFDNDVILALLDWVAEDMTPRLDLWRMRTADPLVRLFQAEAADNGWDLAIVEDGVAPVATLPGDWEAFVASLGKHDRHELRRKIRHLEAAGAVTYSTVTDPAAIDAALETLFALMRASHEGKARFLAPATEAFFRDLAATFAPLGMMRLGALHLDDRLVALLFLFEDDDAVYLYNSGYDPAFAHLAAGLLSKAYAIRDAIARGKRRFEFLHGSEDYKHRLGGVPHPVLDLTFRRRQSG